MHIGLLAADLNYAHGWAHYSLNIALALRRAGADLTVIAARSGPAVDELELHRLLPDTNPMEKYLLARMFQRAPAIRRVLRNCDLIHVFVEPYAPVGAWVAAGRPFFVTAHGSYIDLLTHRRWPAGAVYARAFRRTQRIVCDSQYTAKVAQRVLPGVQTTFIPLGIEAARYAHLPSGEVSKRGPTVLSVGAVKMRKGTLELVRAMALVREAMPEVQCIILGSLDAEPGYTRQVQGEIAAQQLEDCVHLLGHVPEATKLAWYGAADVFALPSMNVGRKFEGFGLTYLEASAAGLPVIGTRDCGAEDAIEPGVTGLLVPQSGVTAALADAIISLLNDPQRAAQMGAAGRVRAQQMTWDQAAHELMRLYEQALS